MTTKVKPHPNAKKVVDTKTGTVYLSAAEAAKVIKCSPEHLRNQLNGNVHNKTTMKYQSND